MTFVTLAHAETDENMQRQVIALTVHIHIAIIAAHIYMITLLHASLRFVKINQSHNLNE